MHQSIPAATIPGPTSKEFFKVDREDHLQRPGLLHIMICAFPAYKVPNFVQKIGCYRCFLNPQNLKGLTVNLVQGLFKQCSHAQIVLLFCRMKPYG